MNQKGCNISVVNILWITIQYFFNLFYCHWPFSLLLFSLGSDFKVPVAYCDAATAWSEDYISEKKSTVGDVLHHDVLKYSTKHYNIELKPLFSAFEPKTFAMTCFRSFLLFYLPLLEPHAALEEDDDDFLQDNQEERPVDLVAPFKKSVKQIIREVSCIRLLALN